jgi:hypothetical protein
MAASYRLTWQMAGVATNVNQLAKVANAEGRFPDDAVQVMAEYRVLAARVEETIDRLAGS